MKLLYLLSRRPLDVARVRREVGKLADVTDKLAERLAYDWRSDATKGKLLRFLDRAKPPVKEIRKGVIGMAHVTEGLANRLHDQHAPVARHMVPAADYSGVIRPAISHGGAGSKGCEDCKLIERAWKLIGTSKQERKGGGK